MELIGFDDIDPFTTLVSEPIGERKIHFVAINFFYFKYSFLWYKSTIVAYMTKYDLLIDTCIIYMTKYIGNEYK